MLAKSDCARISAHDHNEASITLTLGAYWEKRLSMAQHRFTRAWPNATENTNHQTYGVNNYAGRFSITVLDESEHRRRGHNLRQRNSRVSFRQIYDHIFKANLDFCMPSLVVCSKSNVCRDDCIDAERLGFYVEAEGSIGDNDRVLR